MSMLCVPLYELLKKHATWTWGQAQEEAWQQLKDRLASAPILAWPNFNLPFVLYTDWSILGLGAVSAQAGSDGKERVC